MFFYQPIPSIPELFIVRVSDTFSVQAYDAQWKLTDSSSFTNFRRAESLVVRMNGAEVAQDTTTQVSVSDSLLAGLTDTFTGSRSATASDTTAVGLTDSSSIASTLSLADTIVTGATDISGILSTVSVSDTVVIGLTDTITSLAAVITASDSCATQASEALQTVSAYVAASDTLAIAVSDAFSGSQSFSVIDSLLIGVTESSSIAASVSVNDSAAILPTDTITQVSAVIAATESLSIQCSESIATLSATFVASDSCRVALTDTFTGSQSITTTDSCIVQDGGVSSIAASVSCADILAAQLGDIGALSQATISAAESISCGLSESANVIQNTLLSVADSCATQLSEAATIINAVTGSDTGAVHITDTFVGSQALVVSDDLGYLLSEDQRSSLPSSASDSTAIVLSEAAAVSLTLGALDVLAVQLIEVGAQQDLESAIPKTAYDECSMQIEEGAVTELAGPYWSGTTGEERSLVYADSYTMGPRDNPGRIRW